jgi:toxin ParE1/3/4
VRLVRRLPPGALVCGCDLRQRVLQGHGELCRQGRRAVRVVSAPVLARYGWPWYKDHYDKAFGTGDCARSGTSSGGSRRACQRASFDCGRSDGCRPFGRRNAPRGRGWLGTSSSRRLRPRRGDRGGRQTSRRMRVRYTRRAFAEREAISDYLSERSPKGADTVQRAIVRAIRTLEAYPQLGRLTDVGRVRELTVPRFPYKIYYQIEGDEVWVLHIRDARRRPWPDP